MSRLGSLLTQMRMAAQKANKPLTHLGTLSPTDFKQHLFEAAQTLRPLIARMQTENFAAAGLKSHTGTMLAALQNCIINVADAGGRIKITIELGRPQNYKTGDVYAAVASFKYGAVRGPVEHRIVVDSVTGGPTMRSGGSPERNASVMGASAKRTFKKSVLTNTPLSARAQASLSKGINGKHIKRRAIDPSELSVIKPRPPIFSITDAQMEQLQSALAAALAARLKR